jgi:glycosyltransferase involved in cell wall biosynthesis
LQHEPLVSIIIDNYNYGRFLQDAIESALRQSYRRTEVIVVDDGSTDESREIMLGYGDRIVPVVKENGGQASAFNAGFTQSHGEITIFLDADDVLLPSAAERVTETFHARPHIARVQYRMEVIDALGVPTGIVKPHRHLPLPSGDLRRQVLAFPDDIVWLPTSGNAFASRVLYQIFPVPERDYRILADFYLSHLTPLYGDVVSLDEVCAFYRVHGANNYELAAPKVDLAQIRQTIRYCRKTHAYIKRCANILDLPCERKKTLAVSYVANRVISLKLDAPRHPIHKDTPWRLLLLGTTASLRRFDVSWPMKCLFILWFAGMAIAPQTAAAWLAREFQFPEARGPFNKLLGLFHGMRKVPTLHPTASFQADGGPS